MSSHYSFHRIIQNMSNVCFLCPFIVPRQAYMSCSSTSLFLSLSLSLSLAAKYFTNNYFLRVYGRFLNMTVLPVYLFFSYFETKWKLISYMYASFCARTILSSINFTLYAVLSTWSPLINKANPAPLKSGMHSLDHFYLEIPFKYRSRFKRNNSTRVCPTGVNSFLKGDTLLKGKKFNLVEQASKERNLIFWGKPLRKDV